MANGENKIIKRRLANAYLSTVVSISLVLLLVGVASLLLVNAKSVSDYFKENMQICVMMTQGTSDEEAMDVQVLLDKKEYIKSTRFVSKEQGIEEMKEMLGESFLDVFETSPIPASVEVTLTADYVSADSLEVVKAEILKMPQVEEVDYQKSLIDALNANMTRISILIGVFIILLLFISFVLINNTVRLNVFARRFTIHTMKMVGATKSFIRSPFLLGAVFQGLFSALLAIVLLLAGMFLVRREFAQLFEIFSLKLFIVVLGIVIAAGIIICVASTYFVVGKLVSLSKDELYY